MNMNAVVVCADSRMIPAACCVLLNAYQVSSVALDYILVGVGLDKTNIQAVAHFAELKKIPIKLVDHTQLDFENHELRRFGLATLTRLFLDQLLPRHYEKVLYLDTDVFIHDDINELFSMNLFDRPLGAMVDVSKHGPAHVNERARGLGLTEGANMIAASLLLFNWQQTLASGYLEKARKALHNGANFHYLDQDALSVAFDGNFTPIDPSWNADPFMWKILPRLRLVHFAGKVKPWHDNAPKMFEHYRSKFADTLRGTHWPDFIKTRGSIDKIMNTKDNLKFLLKVRKKANNYKRHYL